MMEFIITDIESSVQEICDLIDKVYDKKDVNLEIENTLADIFFELDDNIFVCIEYPYVDRVFRDSYYSYFASKHNEYHRDCIRVTLYSNPIEYNQFRSKEYHGHLQSSFLGYIVIRPTFPNIIGRSLLSKKAFRDSNYLICQFKGNVTVNGIKLEVEGFPHSSQDGESISCAETTVWAIMEYFSNRYPDYRQCLPSHIINILGNYSKKRLLPSNGLTVDQISFALKEFGFGTYIYSRDDEGADVYGAELENIISTYIESGIPIVASLENEEIGHAVLIIGHERDPKIDFATQKTRQLYYGENSIDYIDYTDIFKRFVIQDDNLAPYRLVDLGYPVLDYEDKDDSFAGCIINSVVVPLYKKIYLEAHRAKNLVLNILSDSDFGFRFESKFVFRFFLTSNRSFKNHLSTLDGLGDKIKDDLILSNMPKFIWCAEIFEESLYDLQQATGLIIVDATEASENEQDALLFAGYPNQCIVKFGKEFVTLKKGFHLYTSFKNNLK